MPRPLVENIEGRLCHCEKGKEHKVRGELSLVFSSPIILGQVIDEESTSDDSYHTPPTAGSAIPPVSSSSSSDEENALVLYNSRQLCLLRLRMNPLWIKCQFLFAGLSLTQVESLV